MTIMEPGSNTHFSSPLLVIGGSWACCGWAETHDPYFCLLLWKIIQKGPDEGPKELTSPVLLCPRAEGGPWRFCLWLFHWRPCRPGQNHSFTETSHNSSRMAMKWMKQRVSVKVVCCDNQKDSHFYRILMFIVVCQWRVKLKSQQQEGGSAFQKL